MSNVARLEPAATLDLPAYSEENENIRIQQAGLLALIAEVVSAHSADRALDTLAAALQDHFDCQRVSIAMVSNDQLTLRSISQQAIVDTSNSESKLVVDAMQEACDRETVIRWPIAESKDRDLGILVAHRALAGRRMSMAYCTVPLFHEQQLIGAILLELRDGFAFSKENQQFLERISAVLAPLLLLHSNADRGVVAVGRERLRKLLCRQLGVDHPGQRMLWGILGTLLLLSFIVPVNRSIKATAEIVPIERRLVTAPRAGFVQSLTVVAGDHVKAGQLLASMDASELELEASRSMSEIATAEVEFRAAMASFDRQESAVARSRLAQNRAQQSLVQQQLELSQLRAPIDGLVLMADTTSSLGAPISRGDTLFEIAPVNDYEVHLLVDESNIRFVQSGQIGELSLRARPDQTISLTVQSVHPIAEPANGASQFRVTAVLPHNFEGSTLNLRPGESGQARLDNGTTSLFKFAFGPAWSQLTALKWRWLG